MQISFRRNPKTVGWARRVAIAVLVGGAGFALTFPVAFFFLLKHNAKATPGDPQNALGALTVAMLVSLGVAGMAGAVCLMISAFLGFLKPLRQD